MWVKALGPSSFHFLLVRRNQFLSPAFTLSFFGISISLTLHPDLLLEKLHRNHDLTRIRAIGGSAQVSSRPPSPTDLPNSSQHALVWWKANAAPNLSSLDPRLNLNSQLTSLCFSIPNVPVAQDTSAHTHALAIEAALGGPDHMAARVGTCAQSSLIAAQLLRVREAWPEVWARTGRVQVASAFLCSMMCGSWVGMNEPEACATGMWVHGTSNSPGHWDEGVLEIIGGNREEGRCIRTWLGDVDLSGGGRMVGMVSRYLVDRYRFDHGERLAYTPACAMSNPYC